MQFLFSALRDGEASKGKGKKKHWFISAAFFR
jgi:hypothetical protein